MNKWIISKIVAYQATPHYEKRCRFIPTCSEYSKECFKRFNIFKATRLSLIRFLKCNPLHKIDYDPVPLKGEPKYKSPESIYISFLIKKENTED
jgi:putative membrane protein insertion efficiency factor